MHKRNASDNLQIDWACIKGSIFVAIHKFNLNERWWLLRVSVQCIPHLLSFFLFIFNLNFMVKKRKRKRIIKRRLVLSYVVLPLLLAFFPLLSRQDKHFNEVLITIRTFRSRLPSRSFLIWMMLAGWHSNQATLERPDKCLAWQHERVKTVEKNTVGTHEWAICVTMCVCLCVCLCVCSRCMEQWLFFRRALSNVNISWNNLELAVVAFGNSSCFIARKRRLIFHHIHIGICLHFALLTFMQILDKRSTVKHNLFNGRASIQKRTANFETLTHGV